MTLDEFVKAFAAEFDDTPAEQFTPATNFRKLEEWGSLTALSIMDMVEEEMGVEITGADLRNTETIEELYNLVCAK